MNKTTKNMQKFTPFLWFDDQAEDAVKFRLLPHAQLAILPRAEHMEITTRASWLVPIINEFLDAEMPKTR
jgi:predicted 3-demethylubiquinone-9 3-methyltransferase (glyoxalase superfamily)